VVLDATSLLPGWHDVPLAAMLQTATGLPVTVDNDGNCAALAEQAFGKGRTLENFVVLVVGTGIGGGVVAGGALLRGEANAAAELGHLSVERDGPPCGCGGRGCVELYASGSGLAARAAQLMQDGALRIDGVTPRTVTAEALGRAAAAGDGTSLRLIGEAGHTLGVAVAGLLNTFNPRRVILAGPLMAFGEPFLAPLRAAVAERALAIPRESAEIVVSELGDQGLLGAAALVLWS